MEEKKGGRGVVHSSLELHLFPSKLLTDSPHLLTDSLTKREVMRELPLML